MMLEHLLSARRLPQLMRLADGRMVRTVEDFEMRREEVRSLLFRYEYGSMPPPPDSLSVSLIAQTPCLDNRVVRYELSVGVVCGDKTFSFPLISVIPNNEVPMPAVVIIDTAREDCGKYLPVEQLVARGYAAFDLPVKEVSEDDGDFSSGLASLLVPDVQAPDAPGKLVVWAWAAMRVMDYIETLPDIDRGRVAIIGHSRYGKTALVAGAFDERFRYVISNNSGCGGAALTRGKVGEGHARIADRHGHWFCPTYRAYAEKPDELPVDQHFLLSLIPPRHLLVGSAMEDAWADPVSEYLGAVKTNDVYALYGMTGLVHPDEIPDRPLVLSKGDAHYHLRAGGHDLRLEDWNRYLDFIDKH